MGTNDNETRETLAPSVTAGELISALEGMADACRGAAGAVRVHSTPHGSVFGVPVQPADQDVVRGVLRLADVLAEQAGVLSLGSGEARRGGERTAAAGVLDDDAAGRGDEDFELATTQGRHRDPRGRILDRCLEVIDEGAGRFDGDFVGIAVDGESNDVHDASPSLGGGAHSVGAGDAAGASVREVPAGDPESDECAYCGTRAPERVLLSRDHLIGDLFVVRGRWSLMSKEIALAAGLLDDVYDVLCELEKAVAPRKPVV